MTTAAPWPPEHDDILALMFDAMTARELAELLGTSPHLVRARGHALGLQKPPGWQAEQSRRTTLQRSPFTPEVREIIALLYPDTLTQDIADLIGMPVARVHAYASKYGLRKTPDFVRTTARARTTADHPMTRTQFKAGLVP